MTRFLCFTALFAMALFQCGCKNKTPTAPAPEPTPAPKVKAGDLLKEYGTNAIAADAKYKGNKLQVTGKFSAVQRMLGAGYILTLVAEDADELNSAMVQCTVHESAKDDVAKLQPGQVITVEGTCDGGLLPGQLKVSQCIIVK
jgi:hypothetical protein